MLLVSKFSWAMVVVCLDSIGELVGGWAVLINRSMAILAPNWAWEDWTGAWNDGTWSERSAWTKKGASS